MAFKRIFKVIVYTAVGLGGLFLVWILVVGFNIYSLTQKVSSFRELTQDQYGPNRYFQVESKNGSLSKELSTTALKKDSRQKTHRIEKRISQKKSLRHKKRNFSETYEVLKLSKQILDEHPNFMPCDSVCRSSDFKNKCEGIPLEECFRSYYRKKGSEALNDPAFNFVLLGLNYMEQVTPLELLSLLVQWEKDKGNKWIVAQIMAYFPSYVIDLNARID